MVRTIVISIAVAVLVVGLGTAFWYWRSSGTGLADVLQGIATSTAPSSVTSTSTQEKTTEELIREAHERSANVRGVYMTGDVAVDRSRGGSVLRENIVRLAREGKINGVVIDVKEGGAVYLGERLRETVAEFHNAGAWVIGRLVVFRDTGSFKKHPEFYIKSKNGGLWRDHRGGTWMDAASPEAWEYIAGIAKRATDYGFDEIQFDYIRFPSDGDLSTAVYPVYDSKTPRYVYLKRFFAYLNKELKVHKPDIILSADLFGYVATSNSDLSIGQRLVDIGDSFDYISFMVYPSHYYGGFEMAADPTRGLPRVYFPYRSKNVADVVSSHPYEVVHRSLIRARDFLDGKIANGIRVQKAVVATSTGLSASSTVAGNAASSTPYQKISRAKFRPWLQDFNLGVDTARGIYYDANKVQAQMDAAEDAGASGWLLWNAGNVYTESALVRRSSPVASTTQSMAPR